MDIRKFEDIENQIKSFLSREDLNLDNYSKQMILGLLQNFRTSNHVSEVSSFTDEELYRLKYLLKKKIKSEREKDKLRLLKVSLDYGNPCYIDIDNKDIIRKVMLKLLNNEEKEAQSDKNGFTTSLRFRTKEVLIPPNSIEDLDDMDSYGYIRNEEDIESKIY